MTEIIFTALLLAGGTFQAKFSDMEACRTFRENFLMSFNHTIVTRQSFFYATEAMQDDHDEWCRNVHKGAAWCMKPLPAVQQIEYVADCSEK